MDVSTEALSTIVDELQREGRQTIPVHELLVRMHSAPIVQLDELDRLREIEKVARKIVTTPLWELRGPEYDDAVKLRRLVLGEAG